MAIRMRDLELLDLKALKKLVMLKERNKELLRLEGRKERLRVQLAETENSIHVYLSDHPTARALLEAIRAADAGKNRNSRVNRPRGWLREQVMATMKASRKPITPAQIRDVVATKSPEQATKNLYISIFQLLKRNSAFRRSKKGWVLAKK